MPLPELEGVLAGSFKLSFRFLQDKVRHDFPRILPQMPLSRFAALQWLSFAAAAKLLPWLVGGRVGLHPLAVVFALLAFGNLFGFFGVLLAAILLVALRHGMEWYPDSDLYRKP